MQEMPPFLIWHDDPQKCHPPGAMGFKSKLSLPSPYFPSPSFLALTLFSLCLFISYPFVSTTTTIPHCPTPTLPSLHQQCLSVQIHPAGFLLRPTTACLPSYATRCQGRPRLGPSLRRCRVTNTLIPMAIPILTLIITQDTWTGERNASARSRCKSMI